jgi:hypothetical protein
VATGRRVPEPRVSTASLLLWFRSHVGNRGGHPKDFGGGMNVEPQWVDNLLTFADGFANQTRRVTQQTKPLAEEP